MLGKSIIFFNTINYTLFMLLNGKIFLAYLRLSPFKNTVICLSAAKSTGI